MQYNEAKITRHHDAPECVAKSPRAVVMNEALARACNRAHNIADGLEQLESRLIGARKTGGTEAPSPLCAPIGNLVDNAIDTGLSINRAIDRCDVVLDRLCAEGF